MKKIAYITGTRADFGLMSDVLVGIQTSPQLRLQIYAIGMHLMDKFGFTLKEVQKNFPNAKKITLMPSEDSAEGMSKYFAESVSGLTREFTRSRPDIVLVLGDRAEMLAAACAGLYLNIPVAHIHGGDRSGTIDNTVRHTITKLSHIHFPATREAAKDIEHMGEEKWRIHVVGSPSLDSIHHMQRVSVKNVFAYLGIPVNKRYILLTVHPDAIEPEINKQNMKQVIAAVRTFNMPVIAIYPNADPGSSGIIGELEKEKEQSYFHVYKSIEYSMFVSVIKHAAVWVGNSSAGIIESPSLKIPVINLGDRQKGRTRAKNIFDVPFNKLLLMEAMQRALTDKSYLRMIAHVRNPWGDGHSADRIVDVLVNLEINSKLLTKTNELK